MDKQPKHQPLEPDPPYAAFLVRCWREGEEWLLMLENVATRERKIFKRLEALSTELQAALTTREHEKCDKS